MGRVPRPVRVVLALLALHVLTTFPYDWESGTFVHHCVRVSPDLVFWLGVGFVGVVVFGWRASIGHGIAIGLVLVPLYRVAWSIVPAYWGKPFDLYNDPLLLPGLVHALRTDMGQTNFAWFVGLRAAGLVMAYLLVYPLVRAVLRTASRRTPCVALVVLQGVVLAGWINAPPIRETDRRLLGRGMWIEAASEVGEIVKSGLWRYREVWKHRTEVALVEIAQTPGNVKKLAGADVHLLFVESYGRVSHHLPRDDRAWLRAIESESGEAGLHAISGFARPSVVGGASLLAHAELLSGVQVETQRVFDLMLQGWLKPLPKFFQEQGHETVTVHPIMDRPWPEGARYYGFDREVWVRHLPYEGIRYHWGRMPDQYALARVLQDVVKQAEKPLFVQYVSVTSHGPFSMIPPWFDDWSEAARLRAFDRSPEKTYDINWRNYREHPDLLAAYRDAVAYGLRCMVGYASQLERPSLVIIVGDHQPPGIGDASERAGRLADVPIHLVANRPELLDPFASWGFEPGLVPQRDAPSFPFREFLARFLRAVGE